MKYQVITETEDVKINHGVFVSVSDALYYLLKAPAIYDSPKITITPIKEEVQR